MVLSEVTAVAVAMYALREDRPHRTALVAIAALVIVASPGLLAVPVRRVVHAELGSLFFYAWSVSLTVAATALAWLDGGAGSPLVLLLVLTLTFAALTSPPRGVALMGAGTVGAYLGLVAGAPPPQGQAWITFVVLVVFSAMTCWVSRNQSTARSSSCSSPSG